MSSEPSVSVHRRATLEDRRSARRVEQKVPKRDKGKQKQRQDPIKGKNLADSLDMWPPMVTSSVSTPKGGASSESTSALRDRAGLGIATGSVSPTLVGGRGRRGSVATLLGGGGGERNRNFSSGTNTNTASSQSNSPVLEKPRSSGKFAMFLNSISHWRHGRYSPALSASSTSLGPGTPLSATGMRTIPGRGPGGKTMRSEEGLRYHHKKGASPGGPGECGGGTGTIGATALTSERRASSWGQGDQPVEFKGMDLGSYRLSPVCVPNGARTRPKEVGALSADGEPGLVSSSSSSSGAAVFIMGTADRPLSMFPAAAVATESPVASSSLAGVDAASVASGSHGDVESLGPACFDEDSSTIASVFGDVERGHRQREGGESPSEEGGGSQHASEGGDDFEEEEVDSDDTDGVPVTFSPRRRVVER